jgi:hypothetical protein
MFFPSKFLYEYQDEKDWDFKNKIDNDEAVFDVKNIKELEDMDYRDFLISEYIIESIYYATCRNPRGFTNNEIYNINSFSTKEYFREKLLKILEEEDIIEVSKPKGGFTLETFYIQNCFRVGICPNLYFTRKNYKKENGWIYLIRAENGLYKIGKAKDVEKRIYPFSVHFPMKWEMVCSFETNDYSLQKIFYTSCSHIEEKLENGSN